MTNHTPSTEERKRVLNDLMLLSDGGNLGISFDISDLATYVLEQRKASEEAVIQARIDELRETRTSLAAFVRGTSTNPAADELLELDDRIAELAALKAKKGDTPDAK